MTNQLIYDSIPLFWVAIYKNGRTIHQISSDNVIHSVDELPRDGLRTMVLQDIHGSILATQSFIPGQCLLYRRRVKTIQGGAKSVTHIIGWAMFNTDGSSDSLHVAFVDELKRTVEMGYFTESRGGVKYPIELSSIDRIPIS